MKLAIFLAFLTSLSLSAQSNEGKLTVSFQNVPLSEAIKQIENVSDYTFSMILQKSMPTRKSPYRPTRHLLNRL